MLSVSPVIIQLAEFNKNIVLSSQHMAIVLIMNQIHKLRLTENVKVILAILLKLRFLGHPVSLEQS